MRLSKRLKTVADFVTPGGVVADIGCDHAYTAIYLVKAGIAKHVIAMDINEGPLIRARENAVRYGVENRIEIRQSDGMEGLHSGEADCILIAGMGGRLMVNILREGRTILNQAPELILQPQSEYALVRRHLHEVGYRISGESMLTEDRKYYTVIKAAAGRERYQEEPYYRFGKILLDGKNPCLRDYLEERKRKTERILEQMGQNRRDTAEAQYRKIKSDYLHIIKAIGYFDRI